MCGIPSQMARHYGLKDFDLLRKSCAVVGSEAPKLYPRIRMPGTAGRMLKPRRIIENYWVVRDVGIEVDASAESNGTLGQETPCGWIVVARPVVVQARLLIKFASGVMERMLRFPVDAVVFPKESNV